MYSGEGVFYGLFLGQALLATQHPGGQEFHVALAPLDGGGQKGFQGQPQRFCVFQHAVEDRLRQAMRSDRARVQIGRISKFGLL